MGRRIAALLGGVLVFVLASGAPASASGLAPGQVASDGASAASTVRALGAVTDPGGAASTSAIPADFRAVMGYEPAVVRDGDRTVLVRPDGGCSSPFGPTAYGFATACRQHDLGYDLLRYAGRKGEPLGAGARREVDDAFDTSLHRRCHSASCRAAADVYAGAVTFNSMRQRYGVPAAEPLWHWALAAALGLVVIMLAGARAGVGERP